MQAWNCSRVLRVFLSTMRNLLMRTCGSVYFLSSLTLNMGSTNSISSSYRRIWMNKFITSA